MKGKMTTGAGKPSRSEPWKQTPESRPPPGSLVTGGGPKGTPTPLPPLFLPTPSQIWPPNCWGAGGGGGRDHASEKPCPALVPRDVSPALLGTSAISGKGQRSHSERRERGRGEPAHSGRGGRGSLEV